MLRFEQNDRWSWKCGCHHNETHFLHTVPFQHPKTLMMMNAVELIKKALRFGQTPPSTEHVAQHVEGARMCYAEEFKSQVWTRSTPRVFSLFLARARLPGHAILVLPGLAVGQRKGQGFSARIAIWNCRFWHGAIWGTVRWADKSDADAEKWDIINKWGEPMLYIVKKNGGWTC